MPQCSLSHTIFVYKWCVCSNIKTKYAYDSEQSRSLSASDWSISFNSYILKDLCDIPMYQQAYHWMATLSPLILWTFLVRNGLLLEIYISCKHKLLNQYMGHGQVQCNKGSSGTSVKRSVRHMWENSVPLTCAHTVPVIPSWVPEIPQVDQCCLLGWPKIWPKMWHHLFARVYR
jgi:hypothetical protein